MLFSLFSSHWLKLISFMVLSTSTYFVNGDLRVDLLFALKRLLIFLTV